MYINYDGDGGWLDVYIPRAEAFRHITFIVDRELDGGNDDDVAIIRSHLEDLVHEYDKGDYVDGEFYSESVKRRSLFHKVTRVEAVSHWRNTNADGVAAGYYHGAEADGKYKYMGELLLKCSCADYLLKMKCPHIGCLGQHWKPERLLEPFDTARVGFVRHGRPETIPAALVRLRPAPRVPQAARASGFDDTAPKRKSAAEGGEVEHEQPLMQVNESGNKDDNELVSSALKNLIAQQKCVLAYSNDMRALRPTRPLKFSRTSRAVCDYCCRACASRAPRLVRCCLALLHAVIDRRS